MILLGSTGSIGTNALEVAQSFHIPIESLCAGKNIALLNTQIQTHRPRNVCIADKNDAPKLIKGDYNLFFGNQGILELIQSSKSDLVLNALVGFIGLEPSLKALECNKKLALANKESLVSGGWLLQKALITPIDSEHFGLWYLINQRPIKKLYITASGGAFRNAPLESIATATPEQALKHPNWEMGRKITIDSASMANKLFEMLEAFWLFGSADIDAYIEPSSNVHALIEFLDGSITAHISKPHMKLPIAYALDSKQALKQSFIQPTSLCDIQLAFTSIDTQRYPLWRLKDEILSNPKKGVVLNASNEVAVEAFLKGTINFGRIAPLVFEAIDAFHHLGELKDIESIIELDLRVREFTLTHI